MIEQTTHHDDSEYTYLWEERHKVLYRIELSTLYHQKRERFFDFSDKLAKAVAVIGGSVSFGRVISNQHVLSWVLAAITVTSTFSLVMSFSEKARRHAELARNFKLLRAAVLAVGDFDFTKAQIAEWKSKIATLEASEPPELGSLIIICQNELARAQGHPGSVVDLAWYKRWTAQVFD